MDWPEKPSYNSNFNFTDETRSKTSEAILPLFVKSNKIEDSYHGWKPNSNGPKPNMDIFTCFNTCDTDTLKSTCVSVDGQQQQEEARNKMSHVKAAAREFCEETSAHGFRHAARGDRGRAYRVFWRIVCALALAGITYHLSFLIASYTRYPTQEATSVNLENSEFPSVTFCNQMSYSLSNLVPLMQNESSDIYRYLLSVQGDALDGYEETSTIDFDEYLYYKEAVYSNLNQESIREAGVNIRDFILVCRFSGVPCDLENDFHVFYDSLYFTCFTYVGNPNTDKYAGAGEAYGLSLILYTESLTPNLASDWLTINRPLRGNFYSNVGSASGVRLEIHERGTLPNPRISGLNIDTGQTTSLSLQTKRIEKLPKPYGPCTNRKYLEGVEDFKYSYSRCVDVCQAEYIYDTCGCASTAVPLTNNIQNRGAKYCFFYDNSTVSIFQTAANIECETDAVKSFQSGAFMNCDCSEPCSYIERQPIITHTRWPSPSAIFGTYIDLVFAEWENIESYKHYQQLGETLTDIEVPLEIQERYFWSNFARVNVFFNDMQVVSMTSSASITLDTLFSNLGGSISLWIGLSFVTVIEFAMFCFSLCRGALTPNFTHRKSVAPKLCP